MDFSICLEKLITSIARLAKVKSAKRITDINSSQQLMTVPIIFHVSYTLLNTTDSTQTRMGAHPPCVDLNYFILSYSPSSTSSNISRKVFILYIQVL